MAESDAAAGGLERKLATILSADVAAYSRLMAEDEERTLRTFRAHKEVFEKLVEFLGALRRTGFGCASLAKPAI